MLAASGEWPNPGCDGASTWPWVARRSSTGASGSRPSSPWSQRIGRPCPRSMTSSCTPCTVSQPLIVLLTGLRQIGVAEVWPTDRSRSATQHLAEELPGLAVEPRKLRLFHREEIRGTRVDADPGQQHRQLEVAEVGGLPHHVLAGELVPALADHLRSRLRDAQPVRNLRVGRAALRIVLLEKRQEVAHAGIPAPPGVGGVLDELQRDGSRRLVEPGG